jgi:hypothetical protein
MRRRRNPRRPHVVRAGQNGGLSPSAAPGERDRGCCEEVAGSVSGQEPPRPDVLGPAWPPGQGVSPGISSIWTRETGNAITSVNLRNLRRHFQSSCSFLQTEMSSDLDPEVLICGRTHVLSRPGAAAPDPEPRRSSLPHSYVLTERRLCLRMRESSGVDRPGTGKARHIPLKSSTSTDRDEAVHGFRLTSPCRSGRGADEPFGRLRAAHQ